MSDLVQAVNWAEIFTQVMLVVLTGVVLPKVFQFLNIKNDDKLRAYLSVAIEGGIKAGVSAYAKGQNVTPASVLLSVANDHAVRDNVTMFAKEYLENNAPQALSKLGINGGLSDIIISRLDDVSNALSNNIAGTANNLEKIGMSSVPVEDVSASTASLGAPLNDPDKTNQGQASLPV